MNNLEELKRKTLLGQEALDRTKERLDQLRQELAHERQQRELDEQIAVAAKARDRILQEISKNCSPGSESHLLTLLKAQGLLEIEGDRIFVKGIDRYNQPASLPLEVGLSKLIQEQFPHFLGSGEESIAPSKQVDATMPSQSSSREKLVINERSGTFEPRFQPRKNGKAH